MTSEPGPRLVEVIDLGGTDPAEAFAPAAGGRSGDGAAGGWSGDGAAGGRGGHPDGAAPWPGDATNDRPRRPLPAPSWWRRWDRLTRYSAAAAVIFALVAVIAGARAITATAPVRTSETTRAAVVPAVDALGCPLTRSCSSRPVATMLLDIVRASLPGSRILFSTETYDGDGAQVYRRDIVAATQNVSVQVSSQCRPQASPAIGQAFTVFYFPYDGGSAITVPLGESPPPGLRFGTETQPGAPGCSLTLHLRADVSDDTLAGEPLDYRMRELAQSAPLMVRP